MANNIIDVEFTRDIYNSLISGGYTHIFSLGVDDAGRDQNVKDSYWLEALKSDDDRITSSDQDYLVHKITDHEVIDMLKGADDIVFMIKLPKDLLTADLQDI